MRPCDGSSRQSAASSRADSVGAADDVGDDDDVSGPVEVQAASPVRATRAAAGATTRLSDRCTDSLSIRRCDKGFEGQVGMFLLHVLQSPLVTEQCEQRTVGPREDLDAALAAEFDGAVGVGAACQ